MKKINFIKLFLAIACFTVVFESCHKSYVWGNKADKTPTKFNSDTRTIKRHR